MDSNNSTIQEPINSEQNEQDDNSIDSPRKLHTYTPSSKIHSQNKYINNNNHLNNTQADSRYQETPGINNNNNNTSFYGNKGQESESNRSSAEDKSFSRYSRRGFIICLVIVALGAVYIFQDIFTRQRFADTASNFIVDIQSWSINTKFFYTISKVVSDGSFVVTAIIIVAVVIWCSNRIYTFNFLIVFCFVTSLLSILKLLYNDPRPYMEFPDVTGEECAAEYGNPSGHAMLNAFAAFYGMSLLGQFYKKYWGITLIYGIFLIWVGFTRVHLGVHGVNQVCLGWVYAFSLFVLFRILLFKQMNRFISHLALIPPSKITKYSIFTICAYVAYTLIMIGIFLGVKSSYETSNNEWNLIIESACSASSINSISNKYLYDKCFIDTGIYGAGFGLLFGIVLTNGSLSNCHLYGKFQSQISYLQVLKRLVLIAIVPGSLFGISALIFHFVSASATWARFFVQLNITGFVCGFLIIFLGPKLLNRFNSEIEGDFLKVETADTPYTADSSTQRRIIHFNANIDLSSNRKSPNAISQTKRSTIECQLMDVGSSHSNISYNNYSSDKPNKNLSLNNQQDSSTSNKTHLFPYLNSNNNNSNSNNTQLIGQNLKKVDYSNEFSLPHNNNATNTTLNSTFNNTNNQKRSISKTEDRSDSNILKEVVSPFNDDDGFGERVLKESYQQEIAEQQQPEETASESQQQQQLSLDQQSENIDAQIQNSFNTNPYQIQDINVVHLQEEQGEKYEDNINSSQHISEQEESSQ